MVKRPDFLAEGSMRGNMRGFTLTSSRVAAQDGLIKTPTMSAGSARPPKPQPRPQQQAVSAKK